jgi:trk system potassium uptake protein TrkH
MKKTIHGVAGFLVGLHPLRLVILGYVSYIIVGWILLSLPFAQHGPGAGSLDNLFISTSAMSTTGLVTVSIADSYTLFGQIVILLLIQFGGLGYMTFSSFVILSRKRTLSDTRTEVANVVFSLPKSFRIDKFLRSVILFAAAIETAGAACLYFIFRQAGQPDAVWSAIFHSISSFCTAGFSLYDNSFESFAGNFWLNLIVAILSYTGAVGFIVCVDVWRRITNKIEHITLTSKIILYCTFWVSFVGTAIFFLSEPSIQEFTVDKRLIASFFQAMTSMTTVGFNTIGISKISRASLLLLTTLMIIGASPSGTGGGLKSTTFTALIGIMRSTLQGKKNVYFWGRRVPEERVRLAMATFCFYVTFLLLGVYFLTLTEKTGFEAILFESASALGTVGLSTGITPMLSSMGKIIITFLMFVGRLGPLTFGMSLFLRQKVITSEEDEDVAI